MKLFLSFILALLFIGCAHKWELTWIDPITHEVFSFTTYDPEFKERTLVRDSGTYEQGMKVTEKWILERAKEDNEQKQNIRNK